MGPLLRLGRAAIRHPRLMIAVWGLVVVASFIAAPALFSSLTSDMGGGDSSESGRANERLDELVAQLPPQDRAARPGSTLIGVVDGLYVDDPGTEAALRDAVARIAALPHVGSVADAYGSDDAGLRAHDGRASAVVVTTDRSPEADKDAMADAVAAELGLAESPTLDAQPLVQHQARSI
jgi:hypothetical protein